MQADTAVYIGCCYEPQSYLYDPKICFFWCLAGSASAIRPSPDMLTGCEETPALRALLADPAAVVAYDRVPATAATGVFTLDTATDMFVLHSGQAVPVGGGLLVATGKMWVAESAETDPRAISMQAVGEGLSAARLAQQYMSQVTMNGEQCITQHADMPCSILTQSLRHH